MVNTMLFWRKINEPEKEWPVTFEQVEDSHLRDMLKATQTQRLAMAEELLRLSQAKIVKD